MPIATAVARQSGLLTLNANATGYIAMVLNPYSSNLLGYNNGATLNDINAFSMYLTNILPSIMSTTNASGYRVVSAWLGVTDLTPALTKTGIVSCGSIPQSQVIGTPTADTIRDSLWVRSIPLQKVGEHLGGFYLPMDPAGEHFFPSGNGPINYEVPVIFISAAAANAAISISYVVNYEYVPAPSQTDLLTVEVGPIGQMTSALAKASEFRSIKDKVGKLSLPELDTGTFSKVMTGLGTIGGIISATVGGLSKII